MQVEPVRTDLAQRTLGIVFIVGLLALCLWILQPFLPAIAWGATLVIATWPLLLRLQARLGSRGRAVTVMTLALLLVLVVPIWLAIDTIVENSGEIVRIVGSASDAHIPPPPDWLAGLPLVGPRWHAAWQGAVDNGGQDLVVKIRPYVLMATQWFIGAVGSFGGLLVQFLLTVAVSAVLFARGEAAAAYAMRFGARLAGERGRHAIVLSGKAIRGVALGVVVTAFIQAACSALALVVTGVPYASILSALILMLCVAQLGPALVMLPTVGWLYWSGDTLTGTILLALTIPCMLMDNFLRPILIKKGVDLPLLLILVGVIGGLVAFGLIGLFLGPTVLAVGYTLFDAWVAEAALPEDERREAKPVPVPNEVAR
ncbi:AI-2E family transporter YdiK [Dongia sp.]|uniref:AI-2E family transporter YdiK n=1 Tax=Dongia sp. TaxID=1977262 RepID=UPI003753B503